MQSAYAFGQISGEARIILVTPECGKGKNQKNDRNGPQTFRKAPIQPGILWKYLLEDLPNHEEPKNNIQAIDVPIDGGVGRTEIEIRDQNCGVSDKEPNDVCEKTRVGTPEPIAQEKGQGG